LFAVDANSFIRALEFVMKLTEALVKPLLAEATKQLACWLRLQ
jgi:hypothetical protein